MRRYRPARPGTRGPGISRVTWVFLALLCILAAGCTSLPPRMPDTGKGEIYGINDGRLTVTVIDVGHGDAVLVRGPGSTILVDTGPPEATERVTDALRSSGAGEIDLLVLTHFHNDHTGGVSRILSAFPVREVLVSGPAAGAPFPNWLEKALAKRNTPWKKGYPGSTFTFGDGLSLKVLSPGQDLRNADVNDQSLVCLLEFGRFFMLLSGDVDATGEEALLRSGSLQKVQVLKVPHHGSPKGTTQAFLDCLAPDVAVISCGKENSYGGPSPAVLRRLRDSGISILRTDLDGSVTIRSDGIHYSVATQNGTISSLDALFGQGTRGVLATCSDRSGIAITAAVFDAPGDDTTNLNGEFVEIGNTGSEARNLAGWQLRDSSGTVYSFQETSLAPGKRIRVYTGNGTDTRGAFYIGSPVPVWGNSREEAVLVSPEGCAATAWLPARSPQTTGPAVSSVG